MTNTEIAHMQNAIILTIILVLIKKDTVLKEQNMTMLVI